MKRSAPPKRKTRPNRVNKERKRRAWINAYHSEEFVEWMRGQACQGCGGGPCDVAHTAGGGMGLKGPWTSTLPLCRPCHQRVHAQGWGVIQLTPKSAEILAANTQHLWEARNAKSQ